MSSLWWGQGGSTCQGKGTSGLPGVRGVPCYLLIHNDRRDSLESKSNLLFTLSNFHQVLHEIKIKIIIDNVIIFFNDYYSYLKNQICL